MEQVSVAAKIVHANDLMTNNYDGDLVTLPYDVLRKQLCALQPHADYWFKSMELALLILQFVKSLLTLN